MIPALAAGPAGATTSPLRAIAENETLLRQLLAALPNGSVNVFDRHLRYHFAAGAGLARVGLRAEDLIGRTLAELFDPATVALVTPQYERAFAGEAVAFDLPLGAFVFAISAGPLAGAEGRVEAIVVVAQDVTDRVRAEAALRASETALRESEARFRALVQHASDVVMVHGADGITSYASPSAERVLGYRPDELVGVNPSSQIHPEDVDRLREFHRSVLREPRVHGPIVYRRRHRDGLWRTLESLAQDLTGDPAVGGVVVNARDITERARAETALAESEARFRAVVENLDQAIAIREPGGRVRYQSPSIERILGFAPGELDAAGTAARIHREDLHLLERLYEAARDRPDEHGRVELRMLHRDGAWRHVEVTVRNLIGEPAVRGILVAARDVTGRVRGRRAIQLLVDAGSVLGESLEYDATLAKVARLAVPEFADWCVVYMPGEGGVLRRVASAAADPVRQRLMDEFNARYPVVQTVARGAGHVIVTGEAEMYEDSLDPWYEAIALDDAHLRGLRALGLRSAVVVPMIAGEQTLGAIHFAYAESGRRYRPEDLAWAEEIGRRAALAVENARLHRELDARREELQHLVSRLLAAHEEERRRVAYELHDGAAQMVAAAHQHLQAYAARARHTRPERREQLARALELSQGAVRDVRRVVAGLRPTVLDDFGLEAALRYEVRALEADGWEVDFSTNLGAARLPAHLEAALFRVTQEAITNARKHAGVGRLAVGLARRGRRLRLSVRDRGRGFDPATLPDGAGPGDRVGLAGMRERVRLLGGQLRVESAPDKGTRIVAEVPLSGSPPV